MKPTSKKIIIIIKQSNITNKNRIDVSHLEQTSIAYINDGSNNE